MIKRHIENLIDEVRQQFPCVVLTGPRQVGKTTLINAMYADQQYSYITLDNSLDRALAANKPSQFLDIHPAPCIIDEAQKAPELFPELEYRINEARRTKKHGEANGMYILTGSTRHALMDNAQESLAGRVGIISMEPLSISEIADRQNRIFGEHIDETDRRVLSAYSNDNVYNYIIKGSLPEVYASEQQNLQVFFHSYISTYIEKDLKDVINVSNELQFYDFLRLLASNIGQELVYENYSKAIGITSPTVKAWIGALAKTGVIYLLQPYNEISVAKEIVKRPKIYFFDTGLAAYLFGFTDVKTLAASSFKGRFFENCVINEIRKTFVNAGIEQQLFYYRDRQQKEIDLVYTRNGKINLVEVKAGKEVEDDADKNFAQLKDSQYEQGLHAVVYSGDRLSALSSGTLLIPLSSI